MQRTAKKRLCTSATLDTSDTGSRDQEAVEAPSLQPTKEMQRRAKKRLHPSATLEDHEAVESPSLQPTRVDYCSIFLSHSGKQKGFVERLNDHLVQAGHYPFFDVHSIPKGVPFPEYITQATIHAKLGVVILSDDFMMSSKWPMIELELFTKYAAHVVPLYYKLLPEDLNSSTKLATWKKKWHAMAKKDRTIDVSKWEKAVRDLASQNGEICRPEMSEGDYIRKVVRKICEQLPPLVNYDVFYVKGQRRFIEELQTQFQHKSVIGMHSVGGQGKTTLCKVMANFYKSAHSFESAVMEFPSDGDKHKIVDQCKKVLKRLNLARKERVEDVDCFDQAMQVMKDRMKSQRVFLALDNVWEHCQEEARRILQVGFGPGSKVLVTSRSEELLKDLLTDSDKALVRPLISVNKDEALELFEASFGGDLSFASRNSLDRALSLCSFSGSYHPLALKALGRKLKNMGGSSDPNAIGKNLARIRSDLKGSEEIDDLIKINYVSANSLGKSMFLDVAVVFRRTGSFKERSRDMKFEEMREWLRSLYAHKCGDDEIDNQLQRLALDGLVQYEGDGEQRTLTVHDLYVSLAEREAAASSRILLAGNGNMEAVQWPELERVVLDGRCEETVELQICPKLQLLYARGQRFSEGLQLEGARALRLLKVVCIMLQRISDVGGCPSLRVLNLSACLLLEEIAGMAFPSNLEILHLCCIGRLRRIPDVGGCALLRVLQLEQCLALEEIAGVALPSNLEILRLRNCKSLRRIPDVGGCASLRELDLWGCRALEEIALPSNLEILRLGDCRSSRRIPDVGGCALLRELVLSVCRALEEIALPSNLEVLRLPECTSMRRIPDVGGCASLRELDLSECRALEEMAVPSNPQILRLRLRVCTSLRRITDVGGCASLRELNLSECRALEEVAGMAFPSDLESLCLWDCSSLRRIPDVGGCASLRHVFLDRCEALEEIAGMALPSTLETLRLWDCRSLRRIPNVGGCASLRAVYLDGCEALEEIAGMDLLSNLELLCLWDCRSLRRIPDAGGCASLRAWDLRRCEALEEVAGMALPSDLELLCLYECRSLRRIPDVGGCASLRKVLLEGCGALEEIAGMAPLSNLQMVSSESEFVIHSLRAMDLVFSSEHEIDMELRQEDGSIIYFGHYCDES